MDIHFSKIEPNSEKIYLYDDGLTHDNRDDITCTGILTAQGQNNEIAYLQLFKGDLNYNLTVFLGLKLLSRGFTKIWFEVTEGRATVSRYAKHIRTEDKHDIYEVDLVEAAKMYQQSQG